ncbi:OLC1v1005980C1 [Oldenlandia corymbosa var. corymbosa]|uniref:OLC1v1005980C1 n=1 Tax=Oldenlandia corymbosa var. corymbosa TaxID=529605 RepID=A0AAV1DHZ4_OLDCO|nr:OLC1v1005980C1 [Oldenlandia corymbosa var. corymbosa]
MEHIKPQIPLTILFLTTCSLLLLLCGADVSQDRQKCANQLVGLVGCLPYVSGDPNAKAPTMDCCSGLKVVLDKSKECLCILVRDRNDPSLGLKINATLALGLPDKCKTPANVKDCPALLHLPPNSPDAKVFDDFGNSGNGSVTAPSPHSGTLYQSDICIRRNYILLSSQKRYFIVILE